MDLGLAGKHALVTGSTAGIGYAIAKGLLAEGASVVITDRTQAGVDAALRAKGKLPAAKKVIGIAVNAPRPPARKFVFDKVPEARRAGEQSRHLRRKRFEIDDGNGGASLSQCHERRLHAPLAGM